MDVHEQIGKCKEFLETSYKTQLHDAATKGKKSLIIDFQDIITFSPELADFIIESPEDGVIAMEQAIESFDLGQYKARFHNLPQVQFTMIRDIRSVHLGKFIYTEGLVRQSSDIRPQVTIARFECPSCGNVLTIPQLDTKFKEPSRCSCGRRGKFRMLSKELVDAQRIVLEEIPELLEGGEQPKRIAIFLKEDLVEPVMEKKTTPGSKVRVFGVIKEVAIPLSSGGQSTRYDLMIESNFILPLEETFGELEITDEDKKAIIEISKSPTLMEDFISSTAPSIYGHNKIKEALVLQLMGGVKKTKPDGNKTRGDMHILLVGDPGCLVADERIALGNGTIVKIKELGREHLQKINVQLLTGEGSKKRDYAKVFHEYKKQPVIEIITESGKSIKGTYNHPLLCISKENDKLKRKWKRLDEFKIGDKVAVVTNIPCTIKKDIATGFKVNERKYGPRFKLKLPKYLNSELASFLGYVLGDGWVSKYKVGFVVAEPEIDILNPLIEICKKNFNTIPKIMKRKPREGRKISLTYVEINSSDIANALVFLREKRVPELILKSGNKIVSNFLKWLFEADGTVFNNGRGRRAISLKAKNLELLRDVQTLLLRFSIHSRIIENALMIRRGKDIIKFADNIEFVSIKKQTKLKDLKKDAELFKRIKPKRSEKIIKIIHHEKPEDVYDVEVPKSHRFIANGIISHNTAKSSLIASLAKVAPKSRLTGGKSASGAGLCVSPNSLVITNPGNLETIQNIVEPRLKNEIEINDYALKKDNISDIKIQSLSHDLKLHSKAPSSIWKIKAPKKMIEITLSSGKKIELTENTKLLTIKNGNLTWKKSKDIKEKEYIATPRTLISGNIEKLYSIDLVDSNPVIHNIKPFVKEIKKELVNKYKTLREASKILEIKENQLYFHWSNEKARGNIKLINLKKLCNEVNIDYKPKIKEISLYNGKIHKIPEFITKDFLYISGLIAGDGDIRKSNETFSIRLSNSNEQLRNIFEKTLKNEFALRTDSQTGNEKRPTAIRAHSKILAEILFKLGLCISPKSNKIKMSETLLHFSNELLSEYISGLYDTDGSINLRKTKGSDCIDLTTCSEKLARQLQLVFLRYNIHASLRTREPTTGKIKGNYKRHVLEIRGFENIKKFSENIQLRHPEKAEKIKKILSKNLKSNTNIDIIPGISNKLKEILQKNKISLKKAKFTENLSREKAQKILESLNADKNLKDLVYSDIFWEKIKGIKEKKSEFDYVYDLTVEDSHNFIVDGILVHNTAAVVKDEFLKGWALEAGAIVLANGGYLFIDELDKMSTEDRNALHEALEQQRISISKANIQATLKAETTVLAAANPKLSRFDPYTPIAAQIDLPASLINRFDLIFPIRDIQNREQDEKIASHVLNIHKNPDMIQPKIPAKLYKKYISYAKQHVFPKLGDHAIEEIKEFYVNLRNSNSGGTGEEIKPIPISARQLEALVRLAEGSARLRLSKKVTRKDAKRAIELLRYCLMQVGFDKETGQFDIDKLYTGLPTSTRTKIITVREIINDLEKKIGKNIPIENIMKEALEHGLEENKVE